MQFTEREINAAKAIAFQLGPYSSEERADIIRHALVCAAAPTCEHEFPTARACMTRRYCIKCQMLDPHYGIMARSYPV
jgi:hypothetical protein